MKLILASDHAGRCLKNAIFRHLTEKGLCPRDLGVDMSVEKADYPDYARLVAQYVAAEEYDFGVLVCGTGTGMALAANRIKGVRAANCVNEFMARLARAHNDANILTLGERLLGEGLALAIVDVFLGTAFEGGRHQCRLNKII